MPYEPPPELATLSLARVAELVAARQLPPVDTWSPSATGESAMVIAADGRWFHDGGEITRPAMVRAFSGLLRRDADGSHWLAITVEDAAFIAVDVSQRDGALIFRLNTDDTIVADADHSIVARGNAETPALYLGVRGAMEARLNRSTYLQLAEIAITRGDLTVESGGQVFPLVPR